MNDVIVSRTVTGPGSKSRPPMATYCERIERDRREAMALLRVLEPEPRRERPAELPAHQAAQDPILNAEFVAGLIAGLAISGLVAAALMLGDRL